MKLGKGRLAWGLGALLLVGQAMAEAPPGMAAAVVDLTATTDLSALLPRIAGERVLYVGENHDQYAHHLVQLEVIRQLHASDPQLAIGMEMFQRPFQPILDRYIAGEIDEREMLRQSEWYRRWRFDYRLYRPLLQFAREHGIPVIALNLEAELTDRVSAVGIAGLDPAERSTLPEVDGSDQGYSGRLREIFNQHPHREGQSFDRFTEVQLLWDEGMADRIARWLSANPQGRMVVIAGAGHLADRAGIPQRVERRTGLHGRVLLPAGGVELTPGVADFLLFPAVASLPPAGRIGVLLGGEEGVSIEHLLPGGGGEAAGLREGDRIVAIDGTPVAGPEDIFITLLDRGPGERVGLRYQRNGLALFGGGERETEVVLGR